MTSIISIDCVNAIDDAVLVYGHFNVIHSGHLRYLRYAKSLGKTLVLALIGDNHAKSSIQYQFEQQDRADAILSLNLVEQIVLLNQKELASVVERLRPKFLVLGKEYETINDINIIQAIEKLKSQGGSFQFHAGAVSYASTDLLRNSKTYIEKVRKNQYFTVLKRNNIEKHNLLGALVNLQNAKILVIGDTIVDQYVACEALGMSAEAPVIVVKELDKQNYLGGASIVASHLGTLGVKSTYLSIIGNDSSGDFVKYKLNDYGVNAHLIKDPNRPTTRKKRYLVDNQKLFRVSRLDTRKLDQEIENVLLKKITELIEDVDAVIVSDFVYGVITPKILQKLNELASKLGVLLIGDLQCSSQIGSVIQFENFDLISPNEREARIGLQDNDSGLEAICQKIIKKTNCKNLIMKLGSNGFIIFDQNKPEECRREIFPALSVNPVDVAGAGDSLLAIMAAGLAVKQPILTTAALSCCMTSLAVEKMGNMPISSSELRNRIVDIFNNDI